MGGVAKAAVGVVGGVVGAISAGKAERAARRDRKSKEAALQNKINSRDPVPNPYAGVENLSDLAKNVAGMISNPYANLGVATGAAEMQAEEADISLANTLDTIRATGASAGGATALAQAALQSKKGVAASIEQQEAQNEKLRAQGQQQMEQLQMQEAQRIQGIQIQEGQRVQEAEARGIQFQFGHKEQRQFRDENRLAGLADRAYAQEHAYKAAKQSAVGSIFSSVGDIAGMASLGAPGSGKGGGRKLSFGP